MSASIGVEAIMRDVAGNWIVLVEQKPYTPEDFEGFEFDEDTVVAG